MRVVENPKSRFHETSVELDQLAPGDRPKARLHVMEERARSAVSTNTSPDLSFDHSVNPYRGCFHACAYCYARASHEYLDLGAGTDFERKIIVKTNIATRLRERFDKPSWDGAPIVFSGNTDCYQPLEAKYRLTRACLELCAKYRNPISIITKSALVTRDIDVLQELSEVASAFVVVSVPFADDDMRKKVEPNAAPIAKRFDAIRQLAEAGIEVGVSLAPMIPGLNDSDSPAILQKAHEAGARSAFMTPVRLSGNVLPVFMERIAEAFPLRAKKIENAIREARDGELNDTRFGHRMRGQGERWQASLDLFRVHQKKLGMEWCEVSQRPKRNTFQRPRAQLSLFD